MGIAEDAGRLIGPEHVLPAAGAYLHDATEAQGLAGTAAAVALPGSTEEVTALVRWCYEQGVPIVPRGGGTGFAGGAVPSEGSLVVSLERMRAVRALDPERWRMCVEAGLPTRDAQRLAREHGLCFPPDPGAAEQSQVGGNIATNAGGPHAFKYGATGRWVTGLEAVVPPGEVLTAGGPARKDVAGYDLRSLLIGSEGTLGIVTAAWLRLIPAPEAAYPVAAAYASAEQGCAAVEAVLATGIEASALEYLDGASVAATAGAFPGTVPSQAAFMVLAEADGSHREAERVRADLEEALSAGALALHAPTAPAEARALWRWREGVSAAVGTLRGGKVSEDICVPLEHLRTAIEETRAIGARHGLDACSWGHAGDGNLHSTFMLDRSDPEALQRAQAAAADLFAMALRLGGTISGEHGLGTLKRDFLPGQAGGRAMGLHRDIKRAFDPKGLLNPGKKLDP